MRLKVLALLALATGLAGCRNRGDQPKVLLDAVLMDGTGHPPVSDSIVIVKDGRVQLMGAREGVELPRNGVLFHLNGKFIFPSDPATPLAVGGPANLLIVNVNPASDPEYARKTSGRLTDGHWDQYPQ